ncbi:hypothetical protein ACWD5R_21225 [Streptomyces sp. NPDC002514]|uniref:hypothetical protein n=1 Tax=Streptomyces sp. NPDC001270 TaxID=3364554 RepID=UPI0036BD4174
MASMREDSRRAMENFRSTEQEIKEAFKAWSKDERSRKLERGYREAVSQHKKSTDTWVSLGTRYQQAVKGTLKYWDRQEAARAAAEYNQWQPAQLAAYENYMESNTQQIEQWRRGVMRSLAAQDSVASGSRSPSHQSHGAHDRPYYDRNESRPNRQGGPRR